MKNKKLIIVTVILAIISAFAIFFTQKEELDKTLNISGFGKEEARSLSEEYLSEQDIDLEGYEFAYGIHSNNRLEAFLNKNFDKEEITEILKSDNTPELTYYTRFFKNLEKEEYSVNINPISKRIVSFSRVVKETHEEKTISKEEAESVSISFLEKTGYNPEQLENYDYVEQKFPNRTEQSFTFKIVDSERTSDYGEFFKKVSIKSSGGNIYSFNEQYFIPEEFSRETVGESAYGLLFAVLSFLFSALMVIAAFVIFFKKARKENIRWKLFLGVSTILSVFLIADFLNSINVFKITYLTSRSLTVSLITAAIFAIITVLFIAGIVYVVGSAGDYYHKKENGETNNFLGNIKTAITSKETSISIWVGYMLAVVLTGVSLLIYYIGETYFGVWSYGDAAIMALFTTSIPAISVFAGIALLPAIMEEFLYRFFGVRFFQDKTKSLMWGVIISSLIWAVAHMTYTVFPFYFRGIELLIVGGLLGFYFSRFGIVTTITAHYAYNASLALVASYFIVDTLNFWLIFIVVIIPAVLSIFGFCNNKKQALTN